MPPQTEKTAEAEFAATGDGANSARAFRMLTATPSPRQWRRKEWATFAALALALICAGVLFSAWLDRAGGPTERVAALEATASPTHTASPMAPTRRPTDAPVMIEVTPIVVSAAPTDTPEPAATPTRTPAPSDTPSPIPSDTPTRTHTPRPPTSTPTPTPSGTPTVTPTATPSPTPTPAYARPRLLEPSSGQYFSGAETRIELRWEPVGNLKEDEWYGLIFRYVHEGLDIETGAWLKETSWVVPSYFAGQADEPQRRYEWGVVVVKEVGRRADGSREGLEISPRSEMREFTWR
jgi:hypothetical protein